VGRRGWLVVGGVCLAGAVGLGAWTWFLAGRSLDVRDQWSSVASSFGTFVSLILAVLALFLAGRGPASTPSVGTRGVSVGGNSSAPIVTGDNNSVNG
jgi:hypothetical protein